MVRSSVPAFVLVIALMTATTLLADSDGGDYGADRIGLRDGEDDCNGNGLADSMEMGPLDGYALRFDGVDDYVNPGASAVLANLGQGDFTLEAWVCTNDPGHGILIGNAGIEPMSWNFVIRGVDQGGVIRLRIVDGVSEYLCDGSTSINDGAWHHVAAVRLLEDSSVRLYVDGELDGTISPESAPFSASNDTLIGRDQQSSPHYYNGLMDEVRVWNVGRNQAEIAADMYHALDGTEPGLVAYWRFDEGTGSVAHDSAGGSDGALVGSTSWLAMSDDSNNNGLLDDCEPVRNVTRNIYYTTIQAGIDAAGEGDEIEVRPGRYVECLTLSRKITLRSRDGAATTIIDGNRQGSVITCANCPVWSDTVIDGFTITGGSGTGASYCDGGGIFLYSTSPTIKNCIVVGNICQGAVQGRGAGLYIAGGRSPKIVNCIFSGNQANNAEGGAISMSGGSPTVVNCTFAGNSVTGGSGQGGAICVSGGSPTVVNSVFWGNTAAEGPQILKSGSGTLSVRYCCVEGGWSGTGNIDVDPLFVDADGPDDVVGTLDDDLHLQEGSPCINEGTNSGVSSTDYEGDVRVQECRVDMGADETPYLGRDCNNNGVADACETMPTGVIYVDDDATGGLNDGSSWADAFVDLQEALAYFQCSGQVDEIRVAGGTYKPGTERGDSFWLTDGLALRGGYRGLAGGPGASGDDRNIDAFESILSGDIGVVGDHDDNSHIVVIGYATDETAVIDGFTITDAENPTVQGGGGVYIGRGRYATILRCRIVNNYSRWGGGVYCSDDSHLTAINCAFSSNRSGGHGGAMYIAENTRVTLTGCLFHDNFAPQSGGAIYSILSDSLTLTNCTFVRNEAEEAGGAIQVETSVINVVMKNCIVWGNTAPERPQLSIPTSTPVTYSCIQGGWAGEGNFSVDPFIAEDSLRPIPTASPCVDSGTNDGVPADTFDLDGDGDTTEPIPYDLAGNARFIDDAGRPDTGQGQAPVVDIGAYEIAARVVRSPDLDGDGDVDLTDFAVFQQAFTGPLQ